MEKKKIDKIEEEIESSPVLNRRKNKKLFLTEKDLFSGEPTRKRENSYGSEIKKLEDSEIEMDTTPRNQKSPLFFDQKKYNFKNKRPNINIPDLDLHLSKQKQ